MNENLKFEIRSLTPWPYSAEGCKPVVAALQRMLSAATAGNLSDFRQAKGDMEDAVWSWQTDLFGLPPEMKEPS